MRKLKLFSLALMALFATSAWADTYYIVNGKCNVPLTAGMSSSTFQILKLDGTTLTATEEISSSQTSAASLYYNSTTASYAELTKVANYSSSSTDKRTMQAVKISKGSTMDITLNDITCTKMDVIYRCASSNACKLTIAGVEQATSDQNVHLYSVDGTYSNKITIIGDANKEYQVYVILKMAPIIPSLTGAWKIDTDTVTGEAINVAQGGAAPTLPAFSVGATSGTPTASDYNVAYSLKDGSEEGIFTFTDGVPTAISTATAGTATIIATLTTKNAENYLTPKTNTFEYTVTVAAASAPSFSSVTPSATSVIRGTASNIVAVIAGTPTPTIQWYSNTTASNEGGEAIEGATELTLTLTNAAVGKYYYYAVATNTTSQENNVASEVQVITVTPKAPTLPASADFLGSKSVTIAKAEGEAEEAVIMYSTDGENWDTYSSAIEITATTTIHAKVVQSEIESAVTSVTYTLKEPSEPLDEQADVTGSVTWDWTTVTNSSDINLSNTVLSNVDVLLSNISKYDYTAITGMDNQQALVMNGQYSYRNTNGTKFCQVNWLKINTTVPGTISIEYANTGGNAARTVGVKVGDGSYSYGTHSSDGNVYDGSDASKHKYVIDELEIEAGSITIAGFQVSDKAAKMLRIRKVIFTKSTTTSLSNTTTEIKAVKRLENGMLVIEKDGKTYNVMGQAIR